MRIVPIVTGLWALLTLTGCVKPGVSASKALTAFPSRAELAAAPSKPLPESAFIVNAVRVEQWEVDEASVPAPGAATDPGSATAIKELFGANGRATAAMNCAARELGKFQLSKGTPPEGIRRYVAGRCGVTVPQFTYSAKEFPGPIKSEAAFWEGVSKGIRESQPETASTAVRVDAGAALVQQGNRAFFVLVGGRLVADPEPLKPLPAGQNEVWLRGTLTEPAASIEGIINQGSHGFARCTQAEAVAPPRFSLRCLMAKGDESAWIDVLVQPPKKLLSHTALSVLARREGARAAYVSRINEASSRGSFAQDLLGHLNAVRAQGKLAPLGLSSEQSAVNQHHVGAILGGFNDRGDQSDRLALGLMAGWEIQGTVRRGDILALVTSSTSEPGAWLAEALDHPLSRSVLLEPDRRLIAIGAASPSPQLGVGAVISTYALFDSSDHSADVTRVLQRLNEARLRRGLALASLAELAPLQAASERVFSGRQGVEEALQGALDTSSAQVGQQLQGAYFEAIDLDSLEFPESLLTGPPPGVAITVTHHKVEGAAWGQYVVMLVVIPGGGQQQARAATAAKG